MASQCGGNAYVQHLWQVLNPEDSESARIKTDFLTFQAIKKTMGVTGELPTSCIRQIFLPQRFGGLGYRKANDVVNAAYIGGFALAAHGPHNISQIYPPLRHDVNEPESSMLPSMISLSKAWKEEVELTNHSFVLAKAVAAGVVCPVISSSGEEGEDSYANEKNLERQETTYELRWKMEALKGKTMPEGLDCQALDSEIETRADDRIKYLVEKDLWSDHNAERAARPADYPSLIKSWVKQGGS